ncbi:MAG: complex I subunit 1/NuoH family protein [Verrucomicrobiales bacterium]
MDTFDFIVTLAKIVGLVFLVVMPMVAYTVYAERRVSAIIQDRVGPNRVGLPLTLFGAKKDLRFLGLFQPMADGLKFLLKEDFTPKHVRKFYFWLAPALALVPALLTCAVVPFGSSIVIPWNGGQKTIDLVVANLNVGPLFVFAIASLGVYGIVLGGWASNSKFPFFGGVRSSSQMISYEIALGLSLVPVLLAMGELNLVEITLAQSKQGWNLLPFAMGREFSLERWLLVIPLGIAFITFVISMFAETNRLPFDLPECETELVGGYHTEYSSMKFALFFMGEYAAMVVGSALTVTLFLGGWSLPLGLDRYLPERSIWVGLLHMVVFLAKVVGFLIFFIWVRWTLPRLRYDQLMRLGWIWLFEIALLNILLTAGILMWIH